MAYASARRVDDLEARIERLDGLSRLLDTAFVIPGTGIRFGVDAIIGIIPGVGDWAGVALSSLILIEAARIGIPPALLARMIGNVVIEGIIGYIPIVGDVIDVFWRANRRNMALLREHLVREGRI
jgi:hypothetical protein